MGFYEASSGETQFDLIPATRTLVQAVNRIMSATGNTPPNSLTSGLNQRVEQAKNAVIDAAERIYNAELWQWRYRWRMFQPEDAKMFYDLPGDWAGRGSFALQATTDSSTHTAGPDLKYIDYHFLLEMNPNLRLVPRTIAIETSLSESVIQDAIIDNIGGVPTQFSIIGNQLILFPVPSQDVITAKNLNYSLTQRYAFGFYGTMPPLEDGSDNIPLPPYLMHIHHRLSLAYLKQAIEYGDFVADEQRAEAMLQQAVAQSLQQQGDPELGDFSHGIRY